MPFNALRVLYKSPSREIHSSVKFSAPHLLRCQWHHRVYSHIRFRSSWSMSGHLEQIAILRDVTHVSTFYISLKSLSLSLIDRKSALTKYDVLEIQTLTKRKVFALQRELYYRSFPIVIVATCPARRLARLMRDFNAKTGAHCGRGRVLEWSGELQKPGEKKGERKEQECNRRLTAADRRPVTRSCGSSSCAAASMHSCVR